MAPARSDGPSEAPESPRKVLHITSHFGRPRRNVWLYRLLRGFDRWEAHLLTVRPPHLEEALAEYPWPVDRLTFLPSPSLLGRAADAIQREVSWLFLGRTLSRVSRLVERLQEGRGFDLIHLHRSRLWDDVQGIALPKVASFYGGDVMRRHRPRRTRRLHRILSQGAAIVATSEALRERLVEMRAPTERLHVIPVGIDPDEFPPEVQVAKRRKEPLSGDLRIVTVGRLVEVKAPDALPQVARALLDRGLPFQWTLVGEGRLRDRVLENVRRYGVGERFHLVGSQPFEKVRSLLWEADLMVHNAVVTPDGGRESLGVVLMEAGAMGLPVVSCRVGGIPEVVVDGETGLLVAEADAEAMTSCIATLGQANEVRERMALAAMKRARTLFDSARLAARLENLYDGLV